MRKLMIWLTFLTSPASFAVGLLSPVTPTDNPLDLPEHLLPLNNKNELTFDSPTSPPVCHEEDLSTKPLETGDLSFIEDNLSSKDQHETERSQIQKSPTQNNSNNIHPLYPINESSFDFLRVFCESGPPSAQPEVANVNVMVGNPINIEHTLVQKFLAFQPPFHEDPGHLKPLLKKRKPTRLATRWLWRDENTASKQKK